MEILEGRSLGLIESRLATLRHAARRAKRERDDTGSIGHKAGMTRLGR